MNPHKIAMTGHIFFCTEAVEEWMNGGDDKPETWRDMIAILEASDYYKTLPDFQKESWVARAYKAMDIFDIVMMGGDLNATEDCRVVRGITEFTGTIEECRDYVLGSNLRYMKEGMTCDSHADWDQVVDAEGRVETSVADILKGCNIERRYYDAVDDIELWELVE